MRAPKPLIAVLSLALLLMLSKSLGISTPPCASAWGNTDHVTASHSHQEAICEATDSNCYYVSTTGDDANTGSFERPFRTIQHAVDVMDGGDIIYLRGGTYQENVQIPLSKDGTCTDVECSSGNWSTIKSYPGEWAVIDGGHRETYTIGHWHSGSGSGWLPDGTWGGLADIHYWKVERLEITGGCLDSGGGGGWTASGGPFIIRYVYFHDNISQSRDANPGAIRGYTWHDSLVEYCYFRNNGCVLNDGNCANINIFSDYAASRHPEWDWYNNGPHTITYATRKNEYRYNLFEDTPVGVKHKNDQILCDRSGSDWRYKDYGDKIHHNVFISNTKAVVAVQDFCQVYNNIIIDGRLGSSEFHSTPEMRYITVYNNLVINDRIHYFIPYYEPDVIVNFHPYWYCMNNIVENFANTWDSTSISLGVCMDKDDSGNATINLTDSVIDRNYAYRPQDEEHYRAGRHAGSCSDWLTTEEFNSCYSTTNYHHLYNAEDPLHQGTSGANAYKTRGDHALEGTTTIANGGTGNSHPYLAGITLPSYVGPCSDDGCSWVDEVLALRNLGILAVTDLRVARAVTSSTTLTATLRWTAPTDAITYTLRYSDTVISENNWASAVTATAPFTASTPGSTEWLTAPISYSGGTAYFALKSQNTHGEWSALSNNGFWPHFDVYLPLVLKQLEG